MTYEQRPMRFGRRFTAILVIPKKVSENA